MLKVWLLIVAFCLEPINEMERLCGVDKFGELIWSLWEFWDIFNEFEGYFKLEVSPNHLKT